MRFSSGLLQDLLLVMRLYSSICVDDDALYVTQLRSAPIFTGVQHSHSDTENGNVYHHQLSPTCFRAPNYTLSDRGSRPVQTSITFSTVKLQLSVSTPLPHKYQYLHAHHPAPSSYFLKTLKHS